jgi:ABC-type glycerol-3-phosphate transport system substrate-binding protein
MFDDWFEAGVITFFIIAAVGGVAVFAIGPSFFGGNEGPQSATVTVWGTVDSNDIDETLRGAGIRERESLTVNYTQVPANELRNRLVNALARNEGPDVLLTPHTRLHQLQEFVVSLGPQTYSSRSFRNNFVEGTEIFLRPDGVMALPFAMDPLVMYWNRDMLSSAGFVSPPETWKQLSKYIQRITQVDQAENIDRSAIAMGTAQNIAQNKQILSALFFQAGNPIVTSDESGRPSVALLNSNRRERGAEAALRLYTQFANPAAETYSWNNNMPQDRRAFASNQVAMYFDTGQAISEVRSRNPNLNFDITRIPQREDGQTRTYGTMYGFAMLERVSPQRRGRVFSALQRLAAPAVAESTLENTNLTPVRKQVVANASPENAYKSTLLSAAVTARGWLDPDPAQSDNIFADMITSVISGQSNVDSAIETAGQSLDVLFKN